MSFRAMLRIVKTPHSQDRIGLDAGALLALLSLGVKNIHTGPTLPAFFTPEILKVLQEKFNIGTIATVDEDLATLIG